MLIQAWSRFFIEYELVLKAGKGKGHPLRLIEEGQTLDVVSILESHAGRELGRIAMGGNDDWLSLTLVKPLPKDNVVVLIFRRDDPRASHQMYADLRAGSLRRSDKKSTEVVAVSAHLILSMENTGTHDRPKHKAVLEEMPGVPKTSMQALLNQVLKSEKYEYTDRRGEPQMAYCSVELRGFPSETVENAMKDSTIPGVTLVKPAKIEGLDFGGVIVPKEEKVRLALRPTKEPISILDRIVKWAREHNYEDYRVEIDMPNHRRRVVSLRDEDAASALFVRSVPVDLKKPIDPCSAVVIDELVTHAKGILFPGGRDA
jgi:hypothetical protein